MFQKIMNALSGGKRQAEANAQHTQRNDELDIHDIEKYKRNLKIINYKDLVDFIVQDEIYKIDHDKAEISKIPMAPDQGEKENYTLIDDNEEDYYPITVEEEYRFVLVKKAKPKPTLVMPTKILRQLQDPSDHQQ